MINLEIERKKFESAINNSNLNKEQVAVGLRTWTDNGQKYGHIMTQWAWTSWVKRAELAEIHCKTVTENSILLPRIASSEIKDSINEIIAESIFIETSFGGVKTADFQNGTDEAIYNAVIEMTQRHAPHFNNIELFLFEVKGHGYEFQNTEYKNGRFTNDQLNMCFELWKAGQKVYESADKYEQAILKDNQSADATHIDENDNKWLSINGNWYYRNADMNGCMSWFLRNGDHKHTLTEMVKPTTARQNIKSDVKPICLSSLKDGQIVLFVPIDQTVVHVGHYYAKYNCITCDNVRYNANEIEYICSKQLLTEISMKKFGVNNIVCTKENLPIAVHLMIEDDLLKVVGFRGKRIMVTFLESDMKILIDEHLLRRATEEEIKAGKRLS